MSEVAHSGRYSQVWGHPTLQPLSPHPRHSSDPLRTIRVDVNTLFYQKQAQDLELSKECEVKENKIQSLRLERNQANSQRDALHREVNKLRAEHHVTISELKTVTQERDGANEHAQYASSQLYGLSVTLAARDSSIKSLRLKLDTAKDQHDAKDQEVRVLNSKVKVAASEAVTIIRERDDAIANSQALALQLDAWQTELSLTLQRLASLTSFSKDLRQKYDWLKNDRDEAQRREGEVGRDLKSALSTIAVTKWMLDKANRDIEAMTAHFQAQHEELTSKCASQETRLNDLTKDFEEVSLQLTRSRVKRCKLQDRIDDLEDAANRKDAEIRDALARVQQAEEALHSAQTYSSQLSSDLKLKTLNIDILLEQLDRSKRKFMEQCQEVGDPREEFTLIRTSSHPGGDRAPQELSGAASSGPEGTAPADDVGEPSAIRAIKGKLQQFNDLLSDTATDLSVRVEPRETGAKRDADDSMVCKHPERCRSRDTLVNGSLSTWLERHPQDGANRWPPPLSIARFIIQHFLARECQLYLEGRELEVPDGSYCADNKDDDSTIPEPESRARICAHTTTADALGELTDFLSPMGITLRGGKHGTDYSAHRLVHTLLHEACKLRGTMSAADPSGVFRVVLPCPGDSFSEDEMWDVSDQLIFAPLDTRADCTRSFVGATIAGAVGFGLEQVTAGEDEGAKAEKILEPHVVLESAVQLMLG